MTPDAFAFYALTSALIGVPCLAIAYSFGGRGVFLSWVGLGVIGVLWLVCLFFSGQLRGDTGMEGLVLFIMLLVYLALGLVALFCYMVVGAISMLPDQRRDRIQRS